MPAETSIDLWVGASLVEVVQFKDSSGATVPMADAVVTWRVVDWQGAIVFSAALTTGAAMPVAAQAKATADFGSLEGVVCLQVTPAESRDFIAGNYYAHEIQHVASGVEQVLAFGRVHVRGGLNSDA